MALKKSSALSGFYKLGRKEKIRLVKKFCSLSKEQAQVLASDSPLAFDTANRIIENVLGFHPLPFAIATNFIVNGREVLVPMSIEEPSVVAAASNAAKLCRDSGGFFASADPPIMIGQIQLVGLGDAKKAAEELNCAKTEILSAAAPFAENIASYGGGLRGFCARAIETPRGGMVIAEFHIDVRDSMGANTVNTILEGVAPKLRQLAGGKVRLRIISNLAASRLARATAVWKKETIGEDAVEGVLDAWAFAHSDIFRCATHNKGIMNGIDAVALATGNDWRAVEAGAHAYAAISGRYLPLTNYKKLPNGDLQGSIELPLAVGTVGGAIRSLPTAQVALAILGVKSAGELACIMASVGLAQNFAALRALSTEGIQRGHMELHAKNIAIAAGAKGAQIEKIAKIMVDEKNISSKRAAELLKSSGHSK
ncbi:MAG: hydroxymethylglutaryl-CoA reductase, degradative [Candidatus Micrarchaeota archaeon]|nr:hydroxymethylglutaryl-CoA reductase, degradative [Candidatus Micrarchaeota archaeon]